MSRKNIAMSDDECWAFLRDQPFGTLSTIDGQGFPHAVSTAFVVGDGELRLTSFAKAQKVVNLRRDPRAAVLIEVTAPYVEVRGVLLRGEIEVRDDPEEALEIMLGIRAQHERLIPDVLAQQPEVPYEETALKRVAMTLRPTRIASWDHRKLNGQY